MTLTNGNDLFIFWPFDKTCFNFQQNGGLNSDGWTTYVENEFGKSTPSGCYVSNNYESQIFQAETALNNLRSYFSQRPVKFIFFYFVHYVTSRKLLNASHFMSFLLTPNYSKNVCYKSNDRTDSRLTLRPS